jgi:Flp pilus assembly protein TadD
MLALRRGQYDAAIQHLSLVVERSPDFPTGRFQLATAYRRAGNADKAREQLEVYQRLLKEQKAREIGFRGER